MRAVARALCVWRQPGARREVIGGRVLMAILGPVFRSHSSLVVSWCAACGGVQVSPSKLTTVADMSYDAPTQQQLFSG